MLIALHLLFHLITPATLKFMYDFPYFINEKTESTKYYYSSSYRN